MATTYSATMLRHMLEALSNRRSDGRYEIFAPTSTLHALVKRGAVERDQGTRHQPIVHSYLAEEAVTYLREALTIVMGQEHEERAAVWREVLDSAPVPPSVIRAFLGLPAEEPKEAPRVEVEEVEHRMFVGILLDDAKDMGTVQPDNVRAAITNGLAESGHRAERQEGGTIRVGYSWFVPQRPAADRAEEAPAAPEACGNVCADASGACTGPVEHRRTRTHRRGAYLCAGHGEAQQAPRMVSGCCSCGADIMHPLDGPRPACTHNGETRPNGGVVVAGRVVRPAEQGTCYTDRHHVTDVPRWETRNTFPRCAECVAADLGVKVTDLPGYEPEPAAEAAPCDRAKVPALGCKGGPAVVELTSSGKTLTLCEGCAQAQRDSMRGVGQTWQERPAADRAEEARQEVTAEAATCGKCGRELGDWPVERGDRCAPKDWAKCIRPQAPAEAPADKGHGYTWGDAREVPAADLRAGDVIVNPGAGTAYRTAADGTVRGAGIAHPMPLDGIAWTVVDRVGNEVTAISHTGVMQTQEIPANKRVLRVAQAPEDTAPVLHREPWRGGQICGWQISYGTYGREEYCGRFKALGKRLCPEHQEEHGHEVRYWADGNAEGLALVRTVWGWSVFDQYGDLCSSADDRAEQGRDYGFTLTWEPYEGTEPVELTDEDREDIEAAHAQAEAERKAAKLIGDGEEWVRHFRREEDAAVRPVDRREALSLVTMAVRHGDWTLGRRDGGVTLVSPDGALSYWLQPVPPAAPAEELSSVWQVKDNDGEVRGHVHGAEYEEAERAADALLGQGGGYFMRRLTVAQAEEIGEADEETRVNLMARFMPQDPAEEGTRPCVEIDGAQVYAYREGGVLRVSVDLDTARTKRADGTVPLEISVSGRTVHES